MLTTSPETDQSDAFSVRWFDPADASLSWNYDPMHAPDVMTPLGFDGERIRNAGGPGR